MKKFPLFVGVSLIAILLLLASRSILAQSDPLVGTWKLNQAKSIYDPGPGPQSAVHKYESTGKDSYKITRDSVDATGKASHGEAPIVFDGNVHPQNNETSIMDRRIDAYNLEGMSMKGGKITRVFFRFVSADGKTLTFKTMGIDSAGKWLSIVEIYEKQ